MNNVRKKNLIVTLTLKMMFAKRMKKKESVTFSQVIVIALAITLDKSVKNPNLTVKLTHAKIKENVINSMDTVNVLKLTKEKNVKSQISIVSQ